MRLRSIVFVVAGLGIPLALVIALLPIRWGYAGFNTRAGDTITYLDPSGPAARAGIHLGDRFTPIPGMDKVAMWGGGMGTRITLNVVRNDRVFPIAITFEPFTGELASQQAVTKLIGCASALIAFLIAILVLLRARDARTGGRAAAVLATVGAHGIASAGSLVVGDAIVATFLVFVLPPLLSGARIWAVLALLAAYPPRETRSRRLWEMLGPWMFALSVVAAIGTGALIWYDGPATVYQNFFSGYPLLADLLICLAVIEAMMAAPPAYRAPMQWLGSSWLIAILVAVAVSIGRITDLLPIAQSHYTDLFGAMETALLAFGVAYPVLRHRLVDLNLVVSRATVFGIVSVVIVGVFVGAEWLVGRIFERSIGIAEPGGFVPEAATMAVVLVLGISARSIHRYVESHVSRIFFRRRNAGLEDLRRLAREADAATEATPLMTYGCDAIKRAFAPTGCAWYLRDGDRYALSVSVGDVAERGYAFNAAQALRLRRWHEAFEADEGDAKEHALYVPMTLRGELLGFLRCGAKPDRTPYVEDEIAALVLLTHHVGLAVAWLARDELLAGVT